MGRFSSQFSKIHKIVTSIQGSLPVDTSHNITKEEQEELQRQVDEFEKNYIQELLVDSMKEEEGLINVLIVDDSKVIYKIIKNTLSGYNLHFDHATNGERALELIDIVNYDLVTMDFNMPGMRGIDAIRLIFEKKPDLPVVVISTESEKHTITEALLMGVKQYLVKPFSEDQLTELFNNALADCSIALKKTECES